MNEAILTHFAMKRTSMATLCNDLLADLPRATEGAIIKVHAAKTSLDLCLIDGAEDLNEHVETLQINCREGEIVETFEIAVPNAAGFLIRKTTVCRYREKSKDASDIFYYYCRHSEDFCCHTTNASKFYPRTRSRPNC